jgi:hypothetical protein
VHEPAHELSESTTTKHGLEGMGEDDDVRELQAKLKAAEQEMEVGERARAGMIDERRMGVTPRQMGKAGSTALAQRPRSKERPGMVWSR